MIDFFNNLEFLQTDNLRIIWNKILQGFKNFSKKCQQLKPPFLIKKILDSTF